MTESPNPKRRKPLNVGIERMIQYRAMNGLTQLRLAEKLEVSQPTVGAWEQGRNFPNAKMRSKIAALMGVNAEWLFDMPVPKGDFVQLLDQAIRFTGMTMRELSLDMGYSQTTLSAVRNGHAKRITAEMALYLEDRLGEGWADALVVASARNELQLKREEMGL